MVGAVERRGQVRAEHLGRRDNAVGDRRDGGAEERAEAARPERNAEDVVAALENLDLVVAAHAVDVRAAAAERQVHVRVRHDLLPVGLGVVPADLPVPLHPWREHRRLAVGHVALIPGPRTPQPGAAVFGVRCSVFGRA